jgi:aminoglycoside phosphotransferase (APT) family kinase protein
VELSRSIVEAFDFDGALARVEPMPGGHINPSWQVTTTDTGGDRSYLLQTLNPAVFPDPGQVMRNLQALLAATRRAPRDILPAQQDIRLVPTTAGGDWLEEGDGRIWRAFPFIPAQARDVARNADDARAAGRAFGAFLKILSTYAGPPVETTLAHFHDTAWHLAELERAAAEDRVGRVKDAEAELAECRAQHGLATALAGVARHRMLVHNDAKIANVLFDPDGGQPIAVIDLDTVMVGSPLQDAGDLIRSTASHAREDEPDLRQVTVDPAMVVAVLGGWFDGARGVLHDDERAAAVLAGCVITLEQAVRFLADYLQGDVYYHCADPDQNLRRTRAQLALLASLLDRRPDLEREVTRLAPA